MGTLGMIGLGRMGGNMAERLRRGGHEVVGYDRNPDVSDVKTLAALVKKLEAPRVVWVMVPHGDPTRETVAKLADLLDKGDLVIDGGFGGNTPSTIIDCTNDEFELVRAGAGDIEQYL